MKWIISRYNHELNYLPKYTNDYVLYDRSEEPLPGAIVVANCGSDIYDKFSFIIDNYNSLPSVALYTKANLFKYISKEEFDQVKDNTTYTPLFSKNHPIKSMNLGAVREKTIKEIQDYSDNESLRELFYHFNQIDINDPTHKIKKFSFYDGQGMYNELNIPSFINAHPVRYLKVIEEIQKLMGVYGQEYLAFAPGSNYILPKENILKHPKSFYEQLRHYLSWAVYPGEAMIIERGLHNIWK